MTARLTLALCLLAACGDAPALTPSTATARDSAGVRIVENDKPAWGDSARWSVDADPDVVIGSLEGDNVDAFEYVTGAVRLRDGRIVVADGGANAIHYFAPAGRHLCTTGRTGAGPGEFERLEFIQRLPGDSLLAGDAGSGRLTTLDPRGAFVTSRLVPGDSGTRVAPIGRLLSGVTLTRTYTFFGRNAATGVRRDTSTYLLVHPDGRTSVLGAWPGQERFVLVTGDRMTVGPRAFGNARLHAIAGDQVLMLATERLAIEVFSSGGRHLRSIRAAREPRPATDEDIEEYRLTRLEGATGAMLEHSRAMLAAMSFPDHHPVATSLTPDDDGNIWVGLGVPPGEAAGAAVFDSTGQWLGVVALPRGFALKHVADSMLVGVLQDEDGVWRVQVHRVRKAPRGSSAMASASSQPPARAVRRECAR